MFFLILHVQLITHITLISRESHPRGNCQYNNYNKCRNKPTNFLIAFFGSRDVDTFGVKSKTVIR